MAKQKKKADKIIAGEFSDPKKFIVIKGVRVHNLKNVSINIPKGKLSVFTGVSGSGKSSLVFDTVYAEGQRRYVESLSSYARQFLERINKPDVDFMAGLAPSMAIEQKTQIKNPRSTVGTTTEIYDYLRLLFARIGKVYSPVTNKIVKKDSPESIINEVTELVKDDSLKIFIITNIIVGDEADFILKIKSLKANGFYRLIVKEEIIDLNETEEEDYVEKIYKLLATSEKKKEIEKSITVLIDRINFKPSDKESMNRFNDSIELAYRESDGYVTIRISDDNDINNVKPKDLNFSKYLDEDGIRYEEPEPRLFSFNNPFGACEKCQGFGKTMDIDMDIVISDKKKTIFNGAINVFTTPKHSSHLTDILSEAEDYGVDIHKPYNKLTEKEKEYLFKGGKRYIGLNKFFKNIEREASYKLHYRVLLNRYRAFTTCSECGGSRLRKEALYVKVNDRTIFNIVRMKIDEAYNFFLNIELSEYDRKVSERILEEIISRLKYLNEVGLNYLTMDRLSNSLSGGESQRINLSTSLGSSLVGSIYVLDEPSIGLHP
ncbi:MAG: excinuclease ABC subunit A, partial [Ignavibacteria bacterium]|nr:excinuclease ABC subunit A [Ignavibacteria bacterium]